MKKIDVSFPELTYAVEEALNRLRVNIKFSGQNFKKIEITSSIPSEGKSFVAINLWKMLAEAGYKTAFVDLDIRNSAINSNHNIKFTDDMKDVVHYLSGEAEYQDVLYDTNVENGYIVPCETCIENPSNLLEDSRLKTLLDKLGEEFRYVIVDTPPILNVSDASLVASHCDGAIMVVRAEHTSKEIVKQTMKQLKNSGCKVLGTVLNRVDISNDKYKRYGYYGKYTQKKEK